MSKMKRVSSGSSNTILNYFSTSPAQKAKPQNGGAVSKIDSASNKNKPESNKRERLPSPPGQESELSCQPKAKKKRKVRLTIEDSDSETENKDELNTTKDKKSESEVQTIEERKKHLESFRYEDNSKQDGSKVKGNRSIQLATGPSTPDKPAPAPSKEIESTDEDWLHCKLDWLKPHKICDACRRRPDHPDYDPTTLYVPAQFMNSQTPAHRQWWEMKSKHYDCVLFFKVGKFYELYHMDAAVGVNELGFSYMKGEFAHSGFPESAYARMASTLVAKGYKVARVEQTETPEMMQERCRKTGQNTKFDKVVRREICQVTLRGAEVCGLQDGGPPDAAAAYMIAVAEEESHGTSTYGVCFVDTSIGQFHLGQFPDDKHSSCLLTTLAHYPPALILFDRKSTSSRTSRLLATHCPSARRERVALWTPENTLKTLSSKYYHTNEEGRWPEGLTPFLNEGDVLGQTPAKECHLAIRALSGCVVFLTECRLDLQVLGMSQFQRYTPPTTPGDLHPKHLDSRWRGGSSMVLDAITLRNLRIVNDEGCLYDRLNFCTTAMGKRLLYQWVCAPSCSLGVISERQAAVRALCQDQALCQDARSILTSLPDLERLLAKVHSLGNYLRSKHHPDARAIFYEEKIYSKRKVVDFISILSGFSSALKLVDLFATADAALLTRVTQLPPRGSFPDYTTTLQFFKDGFNQSEAEKEGRITPGAGVDEEYDSILQTIEGIKDELNEYLKEQERYFKCRLAYVGTDKKRYQIEIPVSAVGRAGDRYLMSGARKGYKRFSTEETREFLSRMIEAEEKRSSIMLDLSRRMFERFSGHYAQWEAAVQCVATLDVLLAMAEFARQQSGDVCLPTVTCGDEKPYIDIVEGRHPCIPVTTDFIPNDTRLGRDAASLLLLTGPNMGGKSTLMRQLGLITVLAHLGSYVPAAACSMRLVDRVFTRLGASDDILSHQSTFLVEMTETAAILAHATVHSLVLLDELGRGTSTYDGAAIASAVCVALAERGPRVVFSTHYHSVVRHLADHPQVLLGHMACMVETDESVPESSDEIPEETITFLYKLTRGACPKSYGFNAARLAGIPKEITSRAHQISRSLEKEAACVRVYRAVVETGGTPRSIRRMLADLNV